MIDWSNIRVSYYEPIPPLRGDEWRPHEPCLENSLRAFEEMIREDIMAALSGERPLRPGF